MMSSGSSSPWPVGELTDAQAGTQLPSSPSSCHRPPQGSGQLTRGGSFRCNCTSNTTRAKSLLCHLLAGDPGPAA